MNVYRWEDDAKNDEDGMYDEDNRSLPDIITEIQEILRKRGKKNPIDIHDLSRNIHYSVQDNDELMNKLNDTPLISYEYPLLRFKPIIDADNEEELLSSMRDHQDGIKRVTVETSAPNSKLFINKLVRQGRMVGTNETNSGEMYSIFPRSRRFLTDLAGTATVTRGKSRVEMTENISQEIRQGDAIIIKGRTYRVESSPISTPFSVTSIRSLDERIDTKESKREWAHTIGRDFWLDEMYEGDNENGLVIQRYGVTNDLRTLWFGNNDSILKKDDGELTKAIKEAGLSYASVLVTQTKQIKRSRKK